jgi:hypothetical protein
MKILCKLFGHRITMHDSYAEVCGRCGSHSYYDQDTHFKANVIGMYIWKLKYNLIMWFRWHVVFPYTPIYRKCCDEKCKKTRYIIGREVGNHDDCIPF